jgi:4-amino-4-deoxy-L-arabinose transferase-like glycosyltransferase
VGLLGLLLGLATVWLTWRAVGEVGGADLALAAAAVPALLPMHAFLTGRVNNDGLLNVLFALALWRWACTLRDGPSPREGLRVGLIVGLALLTKQTATLLVALSPVVFILSVWRGHPWRAAARQLAVTLLAAAALALWWYLRNRVVYGDWFAQTAFALRFADRPTPASLAIIKTIHPDWSYWGYVRDVTLRTSVMFIGADVKNAAPGIVNVFQEALLALGGIGAAMVLTRRGRTARRDAAQAWAVLLAVGLLALGVLYWRFNCRYFQAQARYFFPLLPAWGVMLAAGFGRLWPPPRRAARYGLLIVPLWLGLLTVWSLVVFLPTVSNG